MFEHVSRAIIVTSVMLSSRALEAAAVSIDFRANDRLPAPVIRFVPDGGEMQLKEPAARETTASGERLRYEGIAPGGGAFTADIEIAGSRPPARTATLVTMQLRSRASKSPDVEVEWPFTIGPASGSDPTAGIVAPLKNGWARAVSLAAETFRGEYRLGNVLSGKETPNLALPLVHITYAGDAFGIFADPTFSALFGVRASRDSVAGSLRFRYASSRVPLADPEVRRFAFLAAPTSQGGAARFENTVDGFFDLMLPEVSPGPAWLHDIAMISYDFLSDGGAGWDRDIDTLAQWLAPAERRRAALCLHGWYDALGSYAFDSSRDAMKDEWVAFARTRNVKFTQAELRRRLRHAHDLGFRVLLYFGDGLAADSGVPGYRDDWAYLGADGKPIAGWQGPDTFGKTYLRNPAHPEVYGWYLRYLRASLAAFGNDLDGYVWDETFHARLGQVAGAPAPAYCDRALLALVKELAKTVETFDKEKVFLASDCIGVFGWEDVPGYGMVAHGTYQDTHCNPVAWSYGLFPNWRNVLWSCNWSDVTGFHFTRWGVETLGVPVAISNGWGDDRGPSEWRPWERDRVLQLFRERCARPARVQFLAVDPTEVLATAPDRPSPGDPLPEPSRAAENLALARSGGRAAASSEEPGWPARGAIDGVRDDVGWGSGHGWVSKAGELLPQWLEVEFARPGSLTRFVVITYEKAGTGETAGKWGITEYRIEVWDEGARAWRTVVTEARGRAQCVRVHDLPAPVAARKCRLVVTAVAPLDGMARLLQLEAYCLSPAEHEAGPRK